MVYEDKKTQALSPQEAADLLGISRVTVYRFLKEGKVFEAEKIADKWYINPESLPAYIRKERNET